MRFEQVFRIQDLVLQIVAVMSVQPYEQRYYSPAGLPQPDL